MKALSWTDILSRPAARETSRTHAAKERARPAWYRRLHFSLVMVAAMLTGLLAFALFARSTFTVGPATISIGVQPAVRGTTTVTLPPFGSVKASTHTAPLALSAKLDEVDLAYLQELAVRGMPPTRTVEAYKAQARSGTRRAVGAGLMAALAASAFVGWALKRDWRATLGGGLFGLAVPSLFVVSAVLGFQPQAFNTPTYTGALQYAPSLISLVQGRIDRVGDLQKQIDDGVRQLNAYYSHPQSFAGAGSMPNTYRVLQVSDLHLDPVGFKLESELADEFDVSLILDAGDVNNYGTPVEEKLVQQFLDTRYPRVFIPGNHETPEVVRAMSSLKNVTVVESSGTVTIDGLTIFGLADPMSRESGWTQDEARTTAESQAAAARLRASLASGSPAPQIVATHDPTGLKPFAGMAPLLVAGHTHKPMLAKMGSSWYLNSATVGGVDWAQLYSDPSIAHSASILYYTQTLPRRLVAIDRISIAGRIDQSSLQRTVVDPQLLEELRRSAPDTATVEAAGAKAAAAGKP